MTRWLPRRSSCSPTPSHFLPTSALIESLDEPANASEAATTGDPPDAAAAWDAEIERRAADDEGDDLDGPAVMRQLRAEILGR
jgi:hypothetical protein